MLTKIFFHPRMITTPWVCACLFCSSVSYGIGFGYQSSTGWGGTSFQMHSPGEESFGAFANYIMKDVKFRTYSVSLSPYMILTPANSVVDLTLGPDLEAYILEFASYFKDTANRGIVSVAPELGLSVKHNSYPLWPSIRIKYPVFPLITSVFSLRGVSMGVGTRIILGKNFFLTLEYDYSSFITDRFKALSGDKETEENQEVQTNQAAEQTQEDAATQKKSGGLRATRKSIMFGFGIAFGHKAEGGSADDKELEDKAADQEDKDDYRPSSSNKGKKPVRKRGVKKP